MFYQEVFIMICKKKKLAILGLMMFLSFTTLLGSSQSTLSYKVKTGDKNSYTIDKLSSIDSTSGMDHLFTWSDGTSSNVTLKKGVTFSIEVCNFTSSGHPLVKEHINGKTSTCMESFPYVSDVADNTSYYQNYVNKNSSLYQFSNNVFTAIVEYHYETFTDFRQQSWDITTGWLTKGTYKIIATNGTVLFEEIISQGAGSSTPGFDFMIFSGSIVVLVLITKRRKFIH